ncbi:protein BatD (plasmid) [Paroceanicella profunda]|uniref:Protein BatD n=1 Tax=Paroceanicella profunda TaxID=2579971 RepID=A0A5B8FJB9_9RHOB|nr:BatD family protein [Paroceanicella profunda]QDL94088.1 protein BatD [Paroceanicella profunda]
MVTAGLRAALLLVLALLCAPALAQDSDFAPDEARLEVLFDTPDAAPRVGQMMLATLRGTYRLDIAHEDLKLRRMADLDWMRLGQDTWHEELVDGRSARVMERRIAFFPQRAGTITLLPVAHELRYVGRDGVRRTGIVRSPAVSFEVRPAPAGAEAGWLPARAVELSDHWSRDASRLTDGDSVERRVVLRVLGATPQMLPEQPPMRAPWLITFTPPETRDMQLTPAGPVTTVVWTWTLRPITGEPGVLPEVVIPWFDTGEDVAKTVRIPPGAIGYAGFTGNATDRWRSGFGGGAAPVALWLAGALAALCVSARGRSLAGGGLGKWQAMRARARARRALRRCARAGDIGGARLAAASLLAARSEAERHRLLAPLDRVLFGGETAPPAPDLSRLCRAVERAGRDPGR